MALSTARIHRVRGRPPLLAAGIKSLIHSHSSSVRSLGYIFSFIYPFYTTHEDFSDRLLRELSPIRRHLGLLRIAIPQQDQQLACGEPGAGLRALRPPREPTLREALRTQPEALAIIEQNLEGGSRAVAEDIQGAAERIVTEHLAAHGREPIDALAKIDGLGGEK